MRLLNYTIAAVLLLSSCRSGKTEETAAVAPEAPKAAPASKLSPAGTDKLLDLLTSYYSFKDALVASDTAAAAKAAQMVIASGDSLKAYLKTDSTAVLSLTDLDTLILFAQQAASPKDSVLNRQRAAFEPVSDHMFALMKAADLKNAGVYRQFCPMAFNDKGAKWLSNTDEIKNPYFGKKMLECGEVVDSLK